MIDVGGEDEDEDEDDDDDDDEAATSLMGTSVQWMCSCPPPSRGVRGGSWAVRSSRTWS